MSHRFDRHPPGTLTGPERRRGTHSPHLRAGAQRYRSSVVCSARWPSPGTGRRSALATARTSSAASAFVWHRPAIRAPSTSSPSASSAASAFVWQRPPLRASSTTPASRAAPQCHSKIVFTNDFRRRAGVQGPPRSGHGGVERGRAPGNPWPDRSTLRGDLPGRRPVDCTIPPPARPDLRPAFLPASPETFAEHVSARGVDERLGSHALTGATGMNARGTRWTEACLARGRADSGRGDGRRLVLAEVRAKPAVSVLAEGVDG